MPRSFVLPPGLMITGIISAVYMYLNDAIYKPIGALPFENCYAGIFCHYMDFETRFSRSLRLEYWCCSIVSNTHSLIPICVCVFVNPYKWIDRYTRLGWLGRISIWVIGILLFFCLHSDFPLFLCLLIAVREWSCFLLFWNFQLNDFHSVPRNIQKLCVALTV